MDTVLSEENIDKIVKHVFGKDAIYIMVTDSYIDEDGFYIIEYMAPACSSELALSKEDVISIIGDML